MNSSQNINDVLYLYMTLFAEDHNKIVDGIEYYDLYLLRAQGSFVVSPYGNMKKERCANFFSVYLFLSGVEEHCRKMLPFVVSVRKIAEWLRQSQSYVTTDGPDGIKHPLGHKTRSLLLSDICRLFDVGHSL
jgi:hypothetical protein